LKKDLLETQTKEMSRLKRKSWKCKKEEKKLKGKNNKKTKNGNN
jgi:hypothetical protein